MESIESFKKKIYETGKKLKPLELQAKDIQYFYKSLLSCMINIFLKKD